MVASFLESIKYTGHLIPVAFLRIFLGYWYLQQALAKYAGDFLARPRMASQIAEVLPALQLSDWHRSLVERLVIQHWQGFAFAMLALEFAIAISYLLGYVVRPVALLAAILSLNMLMLSTGASVDLWRFFVAVHIAMAWVGAGRCLGMDYYFFKRRRGIWW